MPTKKITLETLARMIKKGFDENTEQHQQIFNSLGKIETKLEGIVYREEFDELKMRVEMLEDLLAIKRKK